MANLFFCSSKHRAESVCVGPLHRVLAMFEDVDVVCNNAGVCLTGTFAATSAEDFRSQMDVVRSINNEIVGAVLRFLTPVDRSFLGNYSSAGAWTPGGARAVRGREEARVLLQIHQAVAQQ